MPWISAQAMSLEASDVDFPVKPAPTAFLAPAVRVEIPVPARFAGTSHLEDESHGGMFVQGAEKEAEVVNSEGITPLDRSTVTIIAAQGEMAAGAANWQFRR